MTKVTFFRQNGVCYGFKEEGHACYGDYGDDILCSALSAMTMLIVNTIEVAYASDIDYKIDDKDAKITVRCLGALAEYEKDEKKRFAVSGIFEGYFLQLNDLLEEYYDYLDVDEIESDEIQE